MQHKSLWLILFHALSSLEITRIRKKNNLRDIQWVFLMYSFSNCPHRMDRDTVSSQTTRVILALIKQRKWWSYICRFSRRWIDRSFVHLMHSTASSNNQTPAIDLLRTWMCFLSCFFLNKSFFWKQCIMYMNELQE